MQIAYYLTGLVVSLGMRLAALGNTKARRIMRGRSETIARLKSSLVPERRTVWFHAASLGEFEQGRPLIEAIRTGHPEWQIVVSFFSPSGYEVRHAYAGADCVVYLPNDSPWSVQAFLDAARPDRAIFIKYDYWPVMLSMLRERGIPTYLVSAIFQPRQFFFKPWGGWYRRLLHCFDYLWVQDRESIDLLARYGVYHADVAGDTRFDRARTIASEACQIPAVARIRKRMPHLIVAGSSWPVDEQALLDYVASRPDVGLVLAPHEIDEAHLRQIEQQATRPTARLSQVAESDAYDILIIDSFGLLASLYRYADVAYVGGGFGKGIHNTVEAAVYGLPMVFGNRIEKFREAMLFVQSGAALVAQIPSEVGELVDALLSDTERRQSAALAAQRITDSQIGATQIIIQSLELGSVNIDNESEQAS